MARKHPNNIYIYIFFEGGTFAILINVDF